MEVMIRLVDGLATWLTTAAALFTAGATVALAIVAFVQLRALRTDSRLSRRPVVQLLSAIVVDHGQGSHVQVAIRNQGVGPAVNLTLTAEVVSTFYGGGRPPEFEQHTARAQVAYFPPGDDRAVYGLRGDLGEPANRQLELIEVTATYADVYGTTFEAIEVFYDP